MTQEKYKFGNPLIDRQRASTEEFCSDPSNDLYFHIRSYYPGLAPLDQFDKSDATLDPVVRKTIRSNEIKWQEIEEIIPSFLGGRAFDAGCGGCSLAWRLRKQFQWIGGDFSRRAILLGKKYLKDQMIPTFELDLQTLPFESESFNFISNIDVIEHIDNKQKVIKEFHRVLKPGGHLLVHTDNAIRTELAVKFRRFTQLLKGQKPDWRPAWEGVEHGHNHLVTLNEIKSLVESCGFSSFHQGYLANGPFTKFTAKFFYCLFKKV